MKYILLFLTSIFPLFVIGQEKAREFVWPVIPMMILDEQARIDYQIKHYWDNFDFSDTMYVHLPDITDQAIVNYVYLLPQAEDKITMTSIKNTLSRAEVNEKVYKYFTKVLNEYIYNPNSPTYNEDYYIPLAEYILTDRTSDRADRERARFNLDMTIKHKVGDVAADFSYVLFNGIENTLHQTGSPYLLLFFFNPDCSHCQEVISYLNSSGIVKEAIEKGSLTVLACYPEKDLDTWKRYLSSIPSNWINGYNKESSIIRKRLYDLKAMPTIYLLDKNKRIVLRHPSAPDIENWVLWHIDD